MANKTGGLRYTRDQYEQAKNASALEYAQSQGYELVKEGGGYYSMKDHDSMIFTPQGDWFWNSRGWHGRAIEFQIHCEHKTVPEAVLTLCGENIQQRENAPRQEIPPQKLPQPDQQEFRLPIRAGNYKQLFAYLCRTRCLSKEIVQEMLKQGVLYESVYRSRTGAEVHNACFVSYGPDGKPCGAYQRGLRTFGEPFKRDVLGSDKQYGWRFRMNPELQPETVAVFEASIDGASYATLLRESAGAQAGAHLEILALGGLDPKPLDNYLAAHPEIRDVLLCLDNDEPGKTAAASIQRRLTEQGYCVIDSSSALGEYKDWNELLAAESQPEPPQQAEPAPEPEEHRMEAGFDRDQIQEIRKGLQDGLAREQLALYTKPEFNYGQMREIREGIQYGLTMRQVSLYAKPEFDSSQMLFIRLGLENGLTMEQLALYAQPNVDSSEMYEIKVGFEGGLSMEQIAFFARPEFD